MMRAPDVVIELPQRFAIPVHGPEIHVAVVCADQPREFQEPVDALWGGRDAGAAAADSELAQGLDVLEPFFGGEGSGHVRLGGEFGLVEG